MRYCLLSALAGVLCLAPSAVARSNVVVPAQVTLTGQSQRIPQDFFGLSIEVNEFAHFEAAGSLFDRMVKLVRSDNGSRLLLRLGGRSADEAYWNLPDVQAPGYVYELDKPWLSQLVSTVRHDRLKIELDLNIAVHSPKMAAQFVRAAAKALPRGTLDGVAVGNEPDLYKIEPWLEKERIPSTLRSTPLHWTEHYTEQDYRNEYRVYAQAVLGAVPGIPLTGPELTYPSVGWPTELLNLRRYAPQSISVHRYATATCKKIGSHPPTAYAFLSDRYTGGLARTVGGDVALARSRGVKIRVTEINSVTCGGRKTLAESFATALWAPDVLFEMMREGVDGVNWHIRSSLPNAPFHLTPDGVEAEPELYGLALFARMIGPRARLEQTSIATSVSRFGLKAWAVSSKRGLKILLLNKDPRVASVKLVAGNGRDAALISRLVAPKLTARTGETFAGQAIGSDGRWHGTLRTKTVKPSSSGVFRLRVPGYTASLVELP